MPLSQTGPVFWLVVRRPTACRSSLSMRKNVSLLRSTGGWKGIARRNLEKVARRDGRATWSRSRPLSWALSDPALAASCYEVGEGRARRFKKIRLSPIPLQSGERPCRASLYLTCAPRPPLSSKDSVSRRVTSFPSISAPTATLGTLPSARQDACGRMLAFIGLATTTR